LIKFNGTDTLIKENGIKITKDDILTFTILCLVDI